MKKKKKLVKFLVSSLTTVTGGALILGAIFVVSVKARQILSPYLGSIPKNRQELTQAEMDVLGTAEQAIKSQDTQKILGLGTQFVESSALAQPIRDLRETIEKRIYETIDNVKQLPANEIQTIKHEVCTQWGEVGTAASSSAK